MGKCPKHRQNHNRPQWGNVQSTDRATTGREKTKEKEGRNMKEQRGKDSERVERRKQLHVKKKRKEMETNAKNRINRGRHKMSEN